MILSLLSIYVFAPLIFVLNRLKSITPVGRREFIEELSEIRFMTNDLRLSAIEHEDGEALKGPRLILFKDNSTDENDGDKHKNRQEQVIVAKQTIVNSDAKAMKSFGMKLQNQIARYYTSWCLVDLVKRKAMLSFPSTY